MLKSFIEHIQETTKPQIATVDGIQFVISSSGAAMELRPDIPHPDTLELNSLDALIQMVRIEACRAASLLYITIPSHLKVRCFAQPKAEERYFRQFFYTAHATDVPGWDASVHLGFEEAQIALRTRFQETEDTLYAMKLLSDIACGAKIVYNDNGIATTVTTQKGVALQANAQIKPLIKLRPYRTFQEVEQPESIFLIRLTERGISFTEADGGMWKLGARETIKMFLMERLDSEVESERVVIAL
ncbi:MAG: hypothetical protein HFH27_12025 [Clostridiaceae bacterium]|nr:hypothetical protein [Clostridiaceae bacterium]MCI9485166.1 hypothetical protein [Clostridiaceae bacterium]